MENELLHQILSELKSIKTDVSELKAGQQKLEAGQQSMKTEIQDMRAEQQLIKRAVMETNESVKRLETIQEQQHRIIEVLSVRSIEQEAAIKRIN